MNSILKYTHVLTVTMLLSSILPFLCACHRASEDAESLYHRKYLAVQKEKDSHWSIIDKNGETVVKDEYAPENLISRISDDGYYWVQSDGKIMLYSLNSPKRPISSREFDAVQDFTGDRTFAIEKTGNQIELINKQGETVKVLPQHIAIVYPYSNGMAQYKDANGKWGYLDKDGNVKITAQYYSTENFSEGYAIVKKERKGDLYIISTNGDVKATVKENKYIINSIFQEGMIGCDRKSDESLVFLNTKGEETINISKKINGFSSGFYKGKAVVTDLSDGFKTGLIDKKGEFVIRLSKYTGLHYTGDGYYIAEKEDKYGIIDANDNEITDFKYDGAFSFMLGNNFVMHDGTSAFLVDKEGNEVHGSDFVTLSLADFTTPLYYYDLKSIAAKVGNLYTPKGYEPLKGQTSIPSIAKFFGKKLEECKWLDKFTHAVDSGNISIETKICLDRFAAVTKYRTEIYNDGWFEYEKQVEDGMIWNDKAKVTQIITQVSLTNNDMAEAFIEKIIPVIKKRGFTNNMGNNCFSDANKSAQIEVEQNGSLVYLTYRR